MPCRLIRFNQFRPTFHQRTSSTWAESIAENWKTSPGRFGPRRSCRAEPIPCSPTARRNSRTIFRSPVGGVTVNPGDFIIADTIGVTVVPLQRAEHILELAKEQAEKTREWVAKGPPVAGAIRQVIIQNLLRFCSASSPFSTVRCSGRVLVGGDGPEPQKIWRSWSDDHRPHHRMCSLDTMSHRNCPSPRCQIREGIIRAGVNRVRAAADGPRLSLTGFSTVSVKTGSPLTSTRCPLLVEERTL
jgi:hypothetical protein